MLGAVLGPGAAGLRQVLPEGGGAEFVVDEAAEGDGVAEELEGGDAGAPDPHGGGDEEDVFEDAAEGEDEGGGASDLGGSGFG